MLQTLEFEITKVLQHRVLKILWFKYLMLFQRLNSFSLGSRLGWLDLVISDSKLWPAE